ncbi:MAG: MBL fold metallo-hydrolase [Anaerovoracaceae bacterium]
MKLSVLIENESMSPEFHKEHGLSLYIEALGKNILFDFGASPNFIENAEKMKVPLKDVDFCVVSHGHYDHTGGIKAFTELNKKAKIYIRHEGFSDFYAHENDGRVVYIGVDKSFFDLPQIVFPPQRMEIMKGVEIFSGVKGSLMNPPGNSQLFIDKDGDQSLDDFAHEQSMIITENDKTYLFIGCAHSGIANIMEQYYKERKAYPDFVLGGFHLFREEGDPDNSELVISLSDYLKDKPSKYYTCHCTGLPAYELLKERLKDQIDYLYTGLQINL